MREEKDLEEKALIASARNMNQDALVRIFDLYSLPLYNYALRLSRDPLLADHVVGDTFAKLLDQLSLGKEPSTSLRSYLYESVYNLVMEQVRVERHEAPSKTVDLNKESSSIKNLELRLLFEAVVLAIKGQLTEDQRHVIILRFLEGFSLDETSEILGKDSSNTTEISQRGFARLKKALRIDNDAALQSRLLELRHAYQAAYSPLISPHHWFERARPRLAGDGTTDAPPPDVKKKKKTK